MPDPNRAPGPPAASAAVAFEVQIHRGHRATAEVPAAEATDDRPAPVARPRSPAAARKARSRHRRALVLRTLAALSLVALGLGWWLVQPPTGALARVNGTYITTAQVDHEVLVNRVFSALATTGPGVSETRTATLERLISQRLQAQAATGAGLVVTDADVDAAIGDLSALQHWTARQLATELARQGLSREDLRAGLHEIVLINRYVKEVVAQPAHDANEAQVLQDTWSARLEQVGHIDRFGDPEADQAARAGAPAPDSTLSDLTGQAIRLQTLRGHPVLLNFWATWCEPCRIEMPTLARAYQQAHAVDSQRDLELLGVAINSAPETVAAFRREFALPFLVLPDTASRVLNLYRVGPIPTSFLIDRQGVIRCGLAHMTLPLAGKKFSHIIQARQA